MGRPAASRLPTSPSLKALAPKRVAGSEKSRRCSRLISMRLLLTAKSLIRDTPPTLLRACQDGFT